MIDFLTGTIVFLLRTIGFLLFLALVLVVLAFIGSIIYAQFDCPFARCRGDQQLIWVIPLMGALYALPALFVLLVWRGIRKQQRRKNWAQREEQWRRNYAERSEAYKTE